jgi:hypothetical protein
MKIMIKIKKILEKSKRSYIKINIQDYVIMNEEG